MVRTTSQAAAVPTAPQVRTTVTVSPTVLPSSSPTRGRNSSREASDQPMETVDATTNASGIRVSAATVTAATTIKGGTRRDSLGGRLATSPGGTAPMRSGAVPGTVWVTG